VSGEHITIGRPLQNTRTYVLDEDLRPVIPTGCGELYIAGECLAEGYISRPELNEVSFIEDIYFPGEKMYRSGDLVRLRTDGRFDYIGRKDAQVKLNGQRVELSEITGTILESGYAVQAAVVPVRKEDGSMELCAFYEGKKGSSQAERKEAIKKYLKKILPVYMIPSGLREVEQMPMTATNKIDMQLLKTMAAGEEPVLKEKTGSNYILSVWNKVLSHPVSDMDVSFFELGGTSMDALHVLSHYFNDHYEMTISQFYENPTAAMQEELLLSEKKPSEVHVNDEKHQERFRSVEQTNISGCDKKQKEETEEKAAFVTGATGFFGVHLIKELLDQNRQVICLLRGGSENRLKECLTWYFGEDYTENVWNRVRVVKGNIREENLGMDDWDYKEICGAAGEIYHCAADVRHYAPDEQDYFKTNVDGTKHALELAKASGAVFYHMSTCSVAGDRLKNEKEEGKTVFTELDFDIGQDWESNIYVKSKYLAEKLVFDAVKEGIEAKIFRLGRLAGRAVDGRFQRNPKTNSFYLHLRGLCMLGALPKEMENIPVDLMPIDLAAREVLKLREGEQIVYHIMSHLPPKMIDVLNAVDKNIKLVSAEEMNRIMNSKMAEMPKELLPFLMEMRMGTGTEIEVTNQITVEQLEKLGFRMELPGPEQLLKDFRG